MAGCIICAVRLFVYSCFYTAIIPFRKGDASIIVHHVLFIEK